MHDWQAIVRRRIDDLGIDPVDDADLIEELADHVRRHFASERRAGVPDDEAMRAAVGELDGHEKLAPELARNRPANAPAAPPPVGGPPRSRWLSGLTLDLRYAFRTLGRSPGFVAVAILAIALSTAPAMLAASVGNWLFVRPVPGIEAPDRLVTVHFGVPTSYGSIVKRVTDDVARRIVAATPAVESVAATGYGEVSISASGHGTRLVATEFVSWNYFDVLGVGLEAGRGFVAGEDRVPGGELVAVISDRLARRHFPDRSGVGESLEMNGFAVRVVGVAPEGFTGGRQLRLVDVWMTGATMPRIRHFSPSSWTPAPGTSWLSTFVIRLAPDVSAEQAGLAMRAPTESVIAAASLPADFDGIQPFIGRSLVSDTDYLKTPFLALLGLSVLLVCAGVANLANLFGFRGLRRGREVAVRRALGASRRRLAQLHLIESLLVAVAGAFLALLVAVAAQRALGGVMLADFEVPTVPLDWRVLVAAAVLATAVGTVMALLPARLATRVDLAAAIGPGSHSTARSGSGIRRALAACQLAVSLTLLVGALLFARTLDNMLSIDPGIDTAGLTAYRFEFETRGFSTEQEAAFFQAAGDRAMATPGVLAVALADGAPVFGGSTRQRIEMPGASSDPEVIRVNLARAGRGYFQALGLALRAGRDFDAEEQAEVRPAVILTASLARRLFSSVEAAVGRAVRLQPSGDAIVVGVTADVWWEDPTEAPVDVVYRPLATSVSRATLLVRAQGPDGRIEAALREAIRAVDPKLPFSSMSASRMTSLWLFEQLLFAWVMGLLSATGFLLAAVGIHGLIWQTVLERTREFGVRLALGARRREIARLVLRSALLVVAIGGPIGLGLAAVLAHMLRHQFFGVTPGDPLSYAFGAVVLVVVALGAGLAPAWSASRSDPIVVLRTE